MKKIILSGAFALLSTFGFSKSSQILGLGENNPVTYVNQTFHLKK